jgi:hypothetical protein
MIKQMYGLSAVFLGFFALCLARPKPNITYTEQDMEKIYPESVGYFHMVRDPSNSNPHQSYRMDETSYRALVPYGIVSRLLNDGKQSFEVVIIAGDQPDTFHNPLVCFASQDFKVQDPQKIMLKTKSRGMVPCMLTEAIKGHDGTYALYTYEGPSVMCPENSDLHRDMFYTQLRTGKPQSATFFRFLTKDQNATKDELEKFAANYLDACPVRPKVHQS